MGLEAMEAQAQRALTSTRAAIRATPMHGPRQTQPEASARYHLEQAERHLKRALAAWYTEEDEDG